MFKLMSVVMLMGLCSCVVSSEDGKVNAAQPGVAPDNTSYNNSGWNPCANAFEIVRIVSNGKVVVAVVPVPCDENANTNPPDPPNETQKVDKINPDPTKQFNVGSQIQR